MKEKNIEKPTDMDDVQFKEFDDEFFLLINKYCRVEIEPSMCIHTYAKVAELRGEAMSLINRWNRNGKIVFHRYDLEK